MKNRLNNEKGFTLIELVMVIVILGILAATAIPKFVDLSSSAENAVRDGVTGALAGGITVLHAQYLINGSGSDYNATSLVANVDTTSITLNVASAISITTSDIGNLGTCDWTYTDNVGNSQATISSTPSCS
jgi:MSHA pilin protein MshA